MNEEMQQAGLGTGLAMAFTNAVPLARLKDETISSRERYALRSRTYFPFPATSQPQVEVSERLRFPIPTCWKVPPARRAQAYTVN